MPILDRIAEYGPKDGNQQLSVVLAPAIEPLTAAGVKVFGRIDGSDEDTLIDGFIASVREACENYLGRALIKRTLRLTLDFWPGMVVELPRPPLISVVGVYTLDESGVTTTYSSSNYYVDTGSAPGRLIIVNGGSPPTNSDRYYGGYRVDYYAGYGELVTDVPAQIKDAMMLWVMQLYETRNLTPEPPPEARQMLELYRVIKY